MSENLIKMHFYPSISNHSISFLINMKSCKIKAKNTRFLQNLSQAKKLEIRRTMGKNNLQNSLRSAMKKVLVIIKWVFIILPCGGVPSVK